MNKIQYISKFFKWIFCISFFIVPMFLILFWINAPQSIAFAAENYGATFDYIPRGIVILHNLTTQTKLLAFFVGCLPAAVSMLLLYFLIKLFSLFEHGDVFTQTNVKYIKYIGCTLFAGQVVSPIYQALISATLTFGNPVGERMAIMSLSGTNLGVLLLALMIVLISWIMDEGKKLKQDQEYTI